MLHDKALSNGSSVGGVQRVEKGKSGQNEVQENGARSVDGIHTERGFEVTSTRLEV